MSIPLVHPIYKETAPLGEPSSLPNSKCALCDKKFEGYKKILSHGGGESILKQHHMHAKCFFKAVDLKQDHCPKCNHGEVDFEELVKISFYDLKAKVLLYKYGKRALDPTVLEKENVNPETQKEIEHRMLTRELKWKNAEFELRNQQEIEFQVREKNNIEGIWLQSIKLDDLVVKCFIKEISYNLGENFLMPTLVKQKNTFDECDFERAYHEIADLMEKKKAKVNATEEKIEKMIELAEKSKSPTLWKTVKRHRNFGPTIAVLAYPLLIGAVFAAQGIAAATLPGFQPGS